AIFRNTAAVRYPESVDSARALPLLARIRASSRLAVLVLLVFALKLGSAAACAQHDFADLGLDGETSTMGLLDVASADPGDPSGPNALSHLGACSHCGSHHASAVPADGFTTAV